MATALELRREGWRRPHRRGPSPRINQVTSPLCPSISNAGDRHEGHLGEVVVEREGFLEAELPHHCEAGAVGEREVLVSIPEGRGGAGSL